MYIDEGTNKLLKINQNIKCWELSVIKESKSESKNNKEQKNYKIYILFKKIKYNEKCSVIFKIKITKLKISKNSRMYIY